MTTVNRPGWNLRWTRPHLAALLVLCAAAGAALAWRTGGRCDLGREMTIRPARVEAATERIDPNTASPASLRRLPGVGAKIAERTIAYRQAHDGPAFATAEDLAAVRGIGPRTVEDARPHLGFSAP